MGRLHDLHEQQGQSPWLDSTFGITDYGHRGVVNVYLAGGSAGNSLETTAVQLTADALGVDIDDVHTVQGDTALTGFGAGTRDIDGQPNATQVVIGISNGFQDNWYWYFGVVAAFFIVFYMTVDTIFAAVGSRPEWFTVFEVLGFVSLPLAAGIE